MTVLQILFIIAIPVVAAFIGLLLYCLCKIAAEADERMDNMRKIK